jgi:hypothetical protein
MNFEYEIKLKIFELMQQISNNNVERQIFYRTGKAGCGMYCTRINKICNK